MIPLGSLVMFGEPRSNTAVVGRVTDLNGRWATVAYTHHGTALIAEPAVASLVPIADAKAALARMIQHGRPIGNVVLAIGYADALATYIDHLEAVQAPTTPHARSESAAGAVPGAGR